MTRPNRGITVSEADFRRMWEDESLTLMAIGQRLGISAQAVVCRADARCLPKRKIFRDRAITDPEFPAMYRAGVSTRELQELYGCAHTVIPKTARAMGLPPRNVGRWSSISIAQFREQQLLARMAEVAAAERAEAKRRAA